jgi:hypothetical protein
MATVLVGDGPQRYFSHDDGSSSWTLQPDKVDDWLASLEASAIALRAPGSGGEDAAKMGVSARNLLSLSLKTEMKKKSEGNLKGEWFVRLHPDTGQV